jgi:pantoate--beta-alanine ligase
MKVIHSATQLTSLLNEARAGGNRIGFVPTMGALHEGHLSLLRAARSSSDFVLMSIFVNPLQFGPSEDLSAYPRDEARDLDLAKREGVDAVFLPSVDEMYPPQRATTVTVGPPLGDVLEGEFRPGHFEGVCTVVAKLFGIVGPTTAFFGQKDAQQAAVIKRMTADLSLPVDISVCPIVREPDGLALSSRNAYLSLEHRRRATVLYESLRKGRDVLLQTGDPKAAEQTMWEVLSSEELAQVDYARVVDPDDFESARPGRPALLAVAARIGSARLIDNLLVERVGGD